MGRELAKLRKELLNIKHLSSLITLAHWDQQVNLPEPAFAERGEQIGVLAKLKHDRLASDELFELASKVAEDKSLDQKSALAATRILEDLVRLRKRPAQLIEVIAEQESETHSAWLEARKMRDFSVVQAALGKMVSLKREFAAAISPERSNYDALVDDFELGSKAEEILARFERMKARLLALRQRCLVAEVSTGRALSVSLKRAEQEKLFRKLAEDLGFDLSRGRLDPTVHPFAAEIGSNDVRLTTKFDEEDLTFALYGFIHEMGHGLYDQGLRPEWAGTPLGEACSLAIHESQSLLFEKRLGLSAGFMRYLSGALSGLSSATAISPEELFSDLNRLSINLIRLSSDEVGYSLHIILRTELESALIDGRISVQDLPDAWAEKTLKYFGRAPKDDLEGVLQDVHWYGGAFGYFPHYLGGAIYSAQLMEKFLADHPTHSSMDSPEHFSALLGWLRREVHSRGREFYAEDLITHVTGKGTDEEVYLKYLEEKYSTLL